MFRLNGTHRKKQTILILKHGRYHLRFFCIKYTLKFHNIMKTSTSFIFSKLIWIEKVFLLNLGNSYFIELLIAILKLLTYHDLHLEPFAGVLLYYSKSFCLKTIIIPLGHCVPRMDIYKQVTVGYSSRIANIKRNIWLIVEILRCRVHSTLDLKSMKRTNGLCIDAYEKEMPEILRRGTQSMNEHCTGWLALTFTQLGLGICLYKNLNRNNKNNFQMLVSPSHFISIRPKLVVFYIRQSQSRM